MGKHDINNDLMIIKDFLIIENFNDYIKFRKMSLIGNDHLCLKQWTMENVRVETDPDIQGPWASWSAHLIGKERTARSGVD